MFAILYVKHRSVRRVICNLIETTNEVVFETPRNANMDNMFTSYHIFWYPRLCHLFIEVYILQHSKYNRRQKMHGRIIRRYSGRFCIKIQNRGNECIFSNYQNFI